MNSDSLHELSLAIVVSIGLAVPVAITITEDQPFDFRADKFQHSIEFAASRSSSTRSGEVWARRTILTSGTVPYFLINDRANGSAQSTKARANEVQTANDVAHKGAVLDQPVPDAGVDKKAPNPPLFVEVD